MKKTLREFYTCMEAHYGPTGWWPGDTPFEIAVGAVLTQNTAWTNVERAIDNLKSEKLLTARAIVECPLDRLETALTPSGYFRVKARRLRSFCEYLLTRYGGSMRRMQRQPLGSLRPELLDVHGVGPETADDILLYACGKLVFVVDAYTRRIFSRHGIVAPNIAYEDLRRFFEKNVEPDLHLYSEYHALIVYVGKDYCRRTPRCAECPLGPTLRKGQPVCERRLR